MEPRIETLTERILIGQRTKMSYTNNQTPALWRSFMPRRKEILDTVGNELYAMQLYPSSFFAQFNPNAEFEKWAAVQVTHFDAIPAGMESFRLKGGLYAVFPFRGTMQEAAQAFQYIYSNWIPNSAYQLDDRPHFELLGEKYKNGDPASEEEFWIPIKPKDNNPDRR